MRSENQSDVSGTLIISIAVLPTPATTHCPPQVGIPNECWDATRTESSRYATPGCQTEMSILSIPATSPVTANHVLGIKPHAREEEGHPPSPLARSALGMYFRKLVSLLSSLTVIHYSISKSE